MYARMCKTELVLGMETFVEKVRNGGGSKFDLMLEERGGWITGEAQQHDVDMADVVIEVMVEANKQILGDDLNPFKKNR